MMRRTTREGGKKNNLQLCVCVCPMHIGVTMIMPMFVQNMCLRVCVCVCVPAHQGAHVRTCAYRCGRIGAGAFDKRGSVCPVVKYGDER